MNATKKYQIWVKVRNSFEYWTLYTEKDTLKEVIEKEKEAIRICFAIDTLKAKNTRLIESVIYADTIQTYVFRGFVNERSKK